MAGTPGEVGEMIGIAPVELSDRSVGHQERHTCAVANGSGSFTGAHCRS
jgi:hypothetical protein